MQSVRRGLALVALLLVGCAGETDGPAEEGEVGESSDAVIGGTETFARPEIGSVWHGNALCTGTLVRPNVVITALHCTGIASDQDVSAVQPGFAFEIRKSATEKRRFTVDRIHSIGTLADMDGSQRWRERDIALLRLTEDVPATLAKPAQVAQWWPRLGGHVAIVGYGCTSRTAGADGRRPGSNTKRAKEYSWTLGLVFGWTDTQNTCPGDSGGPLLDLERNAVVGTTSGYVDGNDRFGNVPANYAAVTSKAAQWWPRR